MQRLQGNRNPDQVAFIIGGGTMLAARWRHRSSKDVDVKVNSTKGYRIISRMAEEPTLEQALDREMRAAGAWGKQRNGAYELIYSFGNKNDDDPPRIELVELPPKLKGQVIRTESEGMQFWSASNEEILAGKWKDRREDPPVRDVFDFALAGEMDGHALQRALATEGTAKDVDSMIERLAVRRSELKSTATKHIDGVPAELQRIHGDPARFAAKAIGMWALTDIAIEQHGGTWSLRTRCRATPEGVERGRHDTIEMAVEEMGRLGGFTYEDVAQITEEAKREGHSRRKGVGDGIRQIFTSHLDVDARGTVLIRDFAETPVRAPTISEAVEIAVERGSVQEERKQQTMEKLIMLQQQAIAMGPTHRR